MGLESWVQIQSTNFFLARLEGKVARNFRGSILTLVSDPRFRVLIDFSKLNIERLPGILETQYRYRALAQT